MSVNGFDINGTIVKYDYNALDNAPIVVTATMSGLTITADHTYAELSAAAAADRPIVLMLNGDVCTTYSVTQNKITFALKPQYVNVVGSGVTNLVSNSVEVSADGWEFWISQSQLTPSAIGAGTYSKPSGGIPASDLASGVQTSLGLADTALQSVPATYRTAAAQDVIDAAKADKVTEVTISTAGAVSQALDPGKLYHFTGALTALTITLNAAGTGVIPQYHFDFDCGSTAPTVTIPNTVVLPSNNTFDASTHYEVDILNNYGVVASWATS